MIIKYIQPTVLPLYCKSGSSYTSVFTVVLTGVTVGLNDATPPTYYGRVRSFDNSGNRGPWTSLIGSVATLIDSAEITELTATKIKAGTITSSIIALDGANSIIKSANYAAGSGGWAIKGDGTAEFGSASIRGGLKAESVFINADNRWRRNAGDTAVSTEFKVGSANKYIYYDGANTLTFTGDLSAAGGTFSGRLQAGDIYVPNTTSPKFKVDTAGNMTCLDAQIDGTLNGVDGTFQGRLQAGDIYIPNTSSPKFFVDGNGNMTCVDATINGTLNGVGGAIAGWNIDSNRLYSGGISLYSSGLIESTLGDVSIKINVSNPSNYYVFEIVNNSNGDQVRSSDTILSAVSGGNFGFVSATGIVTTDEATMKTGWVTGKGVAYPGCTTGPGTYNYMGMVWDNPDIRGTVDNVASCILGTVSDIRFKSEIVPIKSNAIEKMLKQVDVIEYRPIDALDNNRPHKDKKIGIIAQDLKKVFPELISSVDDNDPEAYLSVNYAGMVPYLLACIQKMDKEIEDLKSRIQ